MKVINYELMALAKLTREFNKDLLMELHGEFFSGHNNNLFKLIMKHFSENQRLPTTEILKAIVADKAPKDLLATVNGVITAIERIDVSNISDGEVVGGLKDRQLLTVIDNNVTQLTQKAMQKDVVGVREILNTVVSAVNLQKVKPQNVSEAIEQQDASKIIPSCVEGLDEIITGVAGLTLVGGSSGGGKTTYMMQQAIEQYKAGYNILFISLELSAKVFGNRLKSYLTGIEFSKINRHGHQNRTTGETISTLTPEEQELIKTTMKEFFNRPNVFRIITTPLDSEELFSLIHIDKALYNIDIVYVDYLNLIGSPKGSSGEGWKNLSDTAKALHRISTSHGIVTVSATQVDIEKAPKNGSFPSLRTRGSAELLFSSTLFIFLYSPEAADGQDEGNSIVMYIMKNRNGPTEALLFEKDFARMRMDYLMPL